LGRARRRFDTVGGAALSFEAAGGICKKGIKSILCRERWIVTGCNFWLDPFDFIDTIANIESFD
jgi:hypothetical protein